MAKLLLLQGWQTDPGLFHDGRFRILREVVDHYQDKEAWLLFFRACSGRRS